MIETTLTVQIGDINYGGHLGHDRFITLLHQARLKFLQTLGGDEVNLFGVGLIMRRLECDYLGEAFWGDQLNIKMYISNLRPSRFTLHYEVSRGEDNIAQATTMMVAFNYQTHKVCPLPEAFKQAVITQSLLEGKNV